MKEDKFTHRIAQERIQLQPAPKNPELEALAVPASPKAAPHQLNAPLKVDDYFTISRSFSRNQRKQIRRALECILKIPEVKDQLLKADDLRDALPPCGIKTCLSTKILVDAGKVYCVRDSARINEKRHTRTLLINTLVRHDNYLTRDKKQAPFTLEATLAHELFHLIDPANLMDKYYYGAGFTKTLIEDHGAVALENAVNRHYGRPLRDDYDMKELPRKEKSRHRNLDKRMDAHIDQSFYSSHSSILGRKKGIGERILMSALVRSPSLLSFIPEDRQHFRSALSSNPWDTVGPARDIPLPFQLYLSRRKELSMKIIEIENEAHERRLNPPPPFSWDDVDDDDWLNRMKQQPRNPHQR